MSEVVRRPANSGVTAVVAASDSLRPSHADYICPGTTSDPTTVNAAINAVYAAGGGTVQLLDGTYNGGSNFIVKSGVDIVGNGYSTHIKLSDNTALSEAGLIRVKDSSDRPTDVRISNLRLDGNKANQTVADKNYGVYTEADRVILENCWIHDFPGYGIDPHEAESTSTPGTKFIIRNCYVYDNGTVANEDYDGITLDAQESFICEGNVVFGNARHNINVVTGSANGIIADNVLDDAGRNAIALTGASKYINIVGNHITSSGREAILAAEGSEHLTVVGNFFTNNQRNSVHLIGSKYNVVNSNTMYNNCQAADATYSEIYLDDDGVTYSTYNTVIGNSIVCDAVNRPTYGVEEKNVNNNFGYFGVNNITGMATAATRYVSPNRFEAMGGTQQNATADLGNVLSAIGARQSGGAYTLTTSGLVQFTGAIRYPYTPRTSGATLTPGSSAENELIDATTGNLTININATGTSGYKFTITKIDSSANTVTVNAGSGNTIDGSQTYVLSTQGEYVEVISTATSGFWRTLRRSNGSGGITAPIVSKTADYTLTNVDGTILMDATTGNLTVTLPAVATNKGRVYHIKKIDSSANTVTIDGNASETIDGATTQVISTQWASLSIQSDGATWSTV